MPDKLPQISGERMGRVLTKLGFVLVNQRGSHMKFVRGSGPSKETIMIYAHHTLKKGTLSSMIDQLDLTIEKLKSLL